MTSAKEARRQLNLRLGVRIKDAREKKSLTQEDVERATEIPQSTISAIEKGRRGATLPQLTELARALGCAIDDLMPRPEPRAQEKEPPSEPKQGPMSDWQRKLQASKEAFLARHAAELGSLDIQHVREVAFLSKPVEFPDDEYWFDIVESGRRRRERARRRGDGGKAPA